MPSEHGLSHVNEVVRKELRKLECAFAEPRVQSLQQAATAEASTKACLQAQFAFMKGKLQPDTMVVYDIAVGGRTVHLVHLYCDEMLLPPEYVVVRKGRLPRSAWLEPAAIDGAFWCSSAGGAREDELCAALRRAEVQIGKRTTRLDELARWRQEIGQFRITLNWAMQLVPLDAEHYAFLFRLPYEVVIFSGLWLRLKEALRAIEAVEAAVAQFGYQGEPGPTELPYPTLSVLALPELLKALP